MLGPIFESNPQRHQFAFLDDPNADYSFFDKAYSLEKTVWRPDGESKRASGFDIGKLILKTTEFVDSKSDVLLQAADILANRIRRCFQDIVFDDQTAASLGRLQIGQGRQVVKIITLTKHEHIDVSEALLRRLKLLNNNARAMFPIRLLNSVK